MSMDPQALPDISAVAPRDSHFIWPLGRTTTPDEMNTSYGPRVDADRWDFHDGIDLPAAVGTPVHAMATGTVHRAGPADKTAPGVHPFRRRAQLRIPSAP